LQSHAVDIHGFIPSDDLINRRALGKPAHHVTDAWRPVISSWLMENEARSSELKRFEPNCGAPKAAQDVGEGSVVTPLMTPRSW
jgi:hypothetical protein